MLDGDNPVPATHSPFPATQGMHDNMKHQISRRLALRLGLAATAVGAAALAGLPLLSRRDMLAQARNQPPQPLPVPEQLLGTLKDGVRHYALNIRPGSHQFVSGITTDTFGVNADYLGPVLRLRRGETVRIAVHNGLKEATTLHWHGMHLPAKMDGGPHQEIAPGETWTPQFEVRQPAATLWYHAHPHKRTGAHVWRGLAGPIIIDDDASSALPLPRDHGIDDIPLVLQDRLFGNDGQLLYIQSMHDVMMGMEGNIPLCNGRFMPMFEARRQRLRLRILDGANASFYAIGFSDGRAFDVIASDGGLLPAPVRRTHVLITPGERVEIVVKVGNKPFTLVSGAGLRNMPLHTFLRIVPAPVLESSPALPGKLVELPPPDAASAARTRRFDLQMGMGPGMMMGGMMGRRSPFAINGKAMDMNLINEVIPVGSTEIWEIRNTSPMPHPFHVHDVQFRVLSRNGRPVPAHEAGRKDTVLVDGHEIVRILARFDDYPDPKHPYMYHCHILEHEDAGMMGQFTVV